MAAVAAPVRPDDELLAALVDVATLPGIGGVSLRTALESRDPVAALGRMGAATRNRLDVVAEDRARGWARRALETIHRMDVHVILPGDALYPTALARLAQPPCPLFARGRLELLDTPMVAVVGTRRCSKYGRKAAHRIGWGFGAAGVTVISGLAAGIDGTAHRAAGPERTIGVLGCGIDVVFPAHHRELQDAIGRRGLLLTEQLPGAPPEGHNFPRRNRIIAALAQGVVVVEAPARSGALITARMAGERDGDVFAVPGPIASRQSEGSNALIRDGVKLVTSAREVLLELGLPLPPADSEDDMPPEGLEGQGLALWRFLGQEPRHIDEIATAVGLDSRRSLASLLSLEVRGHARQLSGMRFVRG